MKHLAWAFATALAGPLPAEVLEKRSLPCGGALTGTSATSTQTICPSISNC